MRSWKTGPRSWLAGSIKPVYLRKPRFYCVQAGLFLGLAVLPIMGLHAAAQSSVTDVNCNDSMFTSSATCQGAQQQQQPQQTGAAYSAAQATGIQGIPALRSADNQQVYVDNAGFNGRTPGTNGMQQSFFPPDPVTDLQKLARQATGEMLPIFGRDLFQRAPSTFAPADQIPVTPDYVIGPGDEILLRISGAESFNSQLTVDTAGNIYVPKVGTIQVAGLHASELQNRITAEVNHVYRNYKLSVSLGHLRSIQIYVVGEARRPGAYTISALSTILNALFVSGGPDVQGSLRHIQIRRNGQVLPDFDLYDLVLRGDKSRDARLESGDTIFIPPVGPQVALGGSVRHPALYEIRQGSTLEDVLQLAGGFSATGTTTQLRLERVEANTARQAMQVNLDAAGRAMLLHDGDVLYAGHITDGYEKSVTIRGNLANPGRFAWHPGMKLSEIIPDRRSLLTTNYWRERNRLGVPVPLFEPAPMQRPMFPAQGTRAGLASSTRTDQNNLPEDGYHSNSLDSAGTNGASAVDSATQRQDPANQVGLAIGDVLSSEVSNDPDNRNGLNGSPGSETQRGDGTPLGRPDTNQSRDMQQTASSGGPITRIQIPAPEIDWAYAVIERLNPDTLKSSLVPFNLGKLVQGGDPTQDLPLQPGDVVTILSQRDILVPQELLTKYVRLEGEFIASGVYSVGPDETLEQLIQRAGGFTTKAYLYGSSFQRESARVFQQQRLDEYVSQLSTDMERATAERAASSTTGILDPNALAEQRSLVSQLRQMRATGRVVLEFHPRSTGVASVPPIPLENGDVFRVPSKPNTVSVIGAVYGQNVFLYDPHRHLEDYVDLAGKTNRVADKDHAFIIRADGSIYSRQRAKGVFYNHFDITSINPGDSIVVPEKLIKPSALRQLIDYSSILSSFGLAAAAINVVR